MSKVSMIGTMTCQDGMADEMEAVMVDMAEAARQEPGVEIYSYHRGDGNTFGFFALLTDMAAVQGHGQTTAMRACMERVGPLMGEPPQMTMTTPIAAVGFDC